MKTRIPKFILLLLWQGTMSSLQAQDCFRWANVTLHVLENQCTNKWNLRAFPTNYGHSPYCAISCYQYDLFKNGNHIQQILSGSAPVTFQVAADQPGNYSVKITTIYLTQINACNNGYFTIAIDNSNQVSLTNFCLPNNTLSNVNSLAGTLPATSRTRDYLHTANTVTVSANTSVEFYSAGEISLTTGFSTENDANFIAEIAACTSTATSCSFRLSESEEQSEVQSLFTTVGTLEVFPNPATTSVRIHTANYSQATGTLEVLNMMGEKVLTIEDNGTIKDSYTIDTRQFSGMYLLKLSSAGQSVTSKFIVNN